MYGLLAGLCAWMAGINGAPHLAGQPPAAPAGPMALAPAESVTTRINGRMVRIEVQLYRNLMPVIGTANSELTLFVRLYTPDRRGLPAISSVRATVIGPRHEVWSPELATIPTLVYDPKSMMLSGINGPQWPVNSQPTVRVYIRSGNRTTTVNVPALVKAAV